MEFLNRKSESSHWGSLVVIDCHWVFVVGFSPEEKNICRNDGKLFR